MLNKRLLNTGFTVYIFLRNGPSDNQCEGEEVEFQMDEKSFWCSKRSTQECQTDSKLRCIGIFNNVT